MAGDSQFAVAQPAWCSHLSSPAAAVKKSAPTQESSPAAAQQSAPTKAVDSATAGAITGTVTLEGTTPAPREIMLSGSPACAKLHSSPLIYPEVVTGSHGALADVIVYVKSGVEGYRFTAPATPARIDQRGCMYEPHESAATSREYSGAATSGRCAKRDLCSSH